MSSSSSSSTDSADWYTFLLPLPFIGASAFIRDVVGSGMLPDSPMVWIDVGENIAAYLFSKLVVDFSFDKMFSSGVFEMEANAIMVPAIAGTFNGLFKEMTSKPELTRGLKFYGALENQPRPVEHSGFMNGFIDGSLNVILGGWFSTPFISI